MLSDELIRLEFYSLTPVCRYLIHRIRDFEWKKYNPYPKTKFVKRTNSTSIDNEVTETMNESLDERKKMTFDATFSAW